MITTLTEFDDGSAFERSALAAVYPLLGTNVSRASVDLRNNPASAHVHVFAVENLGEAARAALIDQLRPLLFGAAWKTLDLLFELAFHQANLAPQKSGRWTIAQKHAHAQANLGTLTPFSSDSGVWSRLCALYANTVEARHCLIHRSFQLNSAGDMTNLRAQNGTAQPDVTSSEQQAFCQVSLGAAHAFLSSQFNPRDRSDLIWWIDQLTNHHRLGVLGGGSVAQPATIVRVNAELAAQGWTVDLAQARAGGSIQNAPYFDIEIHFPGTGLPPVTGHLEEAPSDAKVVIDPTTLPQWLHP